MDNEDNGLTKVLRVKRHWNDDCQWDFDEGGVRKAFERVFSLGANYVLFQTIANQEAVDVLKEYMASRENMGSPWKIRKLKSKDKPEYVPGADSECNGLQFDNSLMDSYQCVVDKIATEILGNEHYSHYPMVSTNGVHNLNRDPNAIFWPRVYIVDEKQHNRLVRIVDTLSGYKSFEVLKNLESPQFYQMAEIETLHNLGIAPLVRLPQELRIGAKDLSKHVNFLSQMTELYKWNRSIEDVD